MSGQHDLFSLGEDLDPACPLVYVAMPLSHLGTPEERQLVESNAFIIVRAINESTRDAAEPWPVRVHSPIVWTAPWNKDTLEPEEIYRRNTEILWEDADALIILGIKGASLGAGQELAWACALHRPVLYLYPEGTNVSRQLRGAASEHDIIVQEYATPDEMHDLVGRWLASRRHIICDGPRRRRSQKLRFTALMSAFAAKWKALSTDEQAHVVAVTRIAPGRIARLFASPLALAAASLAEIAALGGALGIDAASAMLARGLPDLVPQQRAALANAAEELGWTAREVLRVEHEARNELARGGIRRLPLASIDDWENFRRRRDGR
ncbi:MAG TPA: hypothetical protein VG294_03900 [Solirubrobacteraceae bacterium]|jgi:hypothetical protein|nr:hypothetical protein [Solirubrobacteraceae bacterium]